MTDRAARPRRSFIFSPGLKPEMFPKAIGSGADIVCVELEDGIAPKDKDEARKHALALFEKPQADDGVERIVRINCLRDAFGLADVQAILATDTPPPALMLPKVSLKLLPGFMLSILAFPLLYSFWLNTLTWYWYQRLQHSQDAVLVGFAH